MGPVSKGYQSELVPARKLFECMRGRGEAVDSSLHCIRREDKVRARATRPTRTSKALLLGASSPKARAGEALAPTAAIAQLAARRSHNPKVVSSILTRRIASAGPICAAPPWGV